jgi:hypothetical protein
MLLLTAVSAITIFLVVLLSPPAHAAEPDTLSAYRESVTVLADGQARVLVTAVLGRVRSRDLLLPWLHEGGRDHEILRGPVSFGVDSAGVAKAITTVVGRPHWNLILDETMAAGDTIAITATVPEWFQHGDTPGQFGSHRLALEFVNTSRFVLAPFAFELILPSGMLVNRVLRTVPAYNPNKNPRPPYSIGRQGDRGSLVLTVATLAPSDRTAMIVTARSARRGWLPLALGGLAAFLYLAFFRDVLRPSRQGDVRSDAK